MKGFNRYIFYSIKKNEPPVPLNELVQKYNQFSAVYQIILPQEFSHNRARSNLEGIN
jgi:hypothetical protein